MFNRVILTAVAVLALCAIAVPAVGLAADRGRHPDPSCTINPSPAAVGEWYGVKASGIPIGTAVNLWVTDPSGAKTGSPLGSTPDGTFSLNEVSYSAGTWTYTFTGPTKQNTVTYSSCSLHVG